MEKKLQEYQKFLESLIKSKETSIFTNGGIDHASVLMSVLFNYTQTKVRMYCRGLYPELTARPRYLDSFKKLLESDKIAIQLLVDDYDNIDKPAFKALIDAWRERTNKNKNDKSIEFKCIQDTDRKNICDELSLDPCNFAVFDDNMFRVEISPEEFKAFGSFNDTEISKKLINLFDTAFENAQKILVN